jgi:hypothetical protein
MAKPDFSGTWTFNPARSALQIAAPDATVFVIEHREPSLRIARTHVKGETRDTFSLDLTTDGQEVIKNSGDLSLAARAYWEHDTLVFETRVVRAGNAGTNVVRYRMAADRMSFVADERFRSAVMNYDNVWVMERTAP